MTGSYWHIDTGCDGQLSDDFQKFAPRRSEGLTFRLASQCVVRCNQLLKHCGKAYTDSLILSLQSHRMMFCQACIPIGAGWCQLKFNKSNANPETLIIMSILGLSKRDTFQKNCQVCGDYWALSMLSIYKGRMVNFYWQEVPGATPNDCLVMAYSCRKVLDAPMIQFHRYAP